MTTAPTRTRPRTAYVTATSLDGYIADPEDSLAWLFVQDIDPDGPMSHDRYMEDVGSMIMGATSYLWLVDHLARTGEAWPYEIPAWVMTHRDLEPLDGADIRFASDDVVAVHDAAMAAADGREVWVVGGGDLAGQLADAGRLDEVIVSIAGVTLGEGRPLFPRRYDLELLELDRNRAFVCARYRVVGPGRWGEDDPAG